MNLSDWLHATSLTNKTISAVERERRKAVRQRVLEKAGTTINTLRVAACRGHLGPDLLKRLSEATAGEKEKITKK